MDSFAIKHEGWLETELGDGPIITSRVRLARNLADDYFPGMASDETLAKIWSRVSDLFAQGSLIEDQRIYALDELDALEKRILLERHIISRNFINSAVGSGIILSSDEHISIMVNEEDHLRMHVMKPGLCLRDAWLKLNEIDDGVEAKLPYAFSSRLGYLTSCPTNLGTGLRASVMVHMPGLVLLEEMDAIIKGISKLGLTVRGLWGEGSQAEGNMFQISNQITLGKGESEILEHLKQVALELSEHEKNARKRLMETQKERVRNHVGRAYGILLHATIISSDEAINLISALRLGADLGLIRHFERKAIDRLFIQTRPAHLQAIEGRRLTSRERDVVRARLIRKRLKEARG